MRDKRQLTEQLVKHLDPSLDYTVKNAMSTWWFNLRKNGGMRLTAVGYQTFVEKLKLEHYQYSIENPMSFNHETILNLDRKMQMPYYIHAVKGIPKKIMFFGSQEAVMANLYGNLEQFLDNYRP
jgi:hypothetical protein